MMSQTERGTMEQHFGHGMEHRAVAGLQVLAQALLRVARRRRAVPAGAGRRFSAFAPVGG